MNLNNLRYMILCLQIMTKMKLQSEIRQSDRKATIMYSFKVKPHKIRK